MGDFRKYIVHTDFEEKNSCKEITGKKIPRLKKIYFTAYDAGKKSYTRKNSITRGLGKKLLQKQNHP